MSRTLVNIFDCCPQIFCVNVLLYLYPSPAASKWPKINQIICYTRTRSEAKSRKNTPPSGRLQRGPPGAPPAGAPHQPGGGGGRGCAAAPVYCLDPVYWLLTQPVPNPYFRTYGIKKTKQVRTLPGVCTHMHAPFGLFS